MVSPRETIPLAWQKVWFYPAKEYLSQSKTIRKSIPLIMR